MSMLGDAQKHLEIAFQYAQLDEEIKERLKYPSLTIQATLPMRYDDGTLRMHKAYRSRFDSMTGVSKGGVRFSPDTNVDEIQCLSCLMALKCSVAGLKFSGGKGSVQIDPSTLSHRELERISKLYIDAFANFIGEDIDSLGPDSGTDERIMGWMYSRYRELKGGQPRRVVTGKPVALGGIPGRTSATGYGGCFVLEQLLSNKYFPLLKLPCRQTVSSDNIPSPYNLRVAIQGFGNVGYWFAKKAHESGLRVVAIGDKTDATYDPNGLDVHACKIARDAGQDWPVGQKIATQQLLELDCDILVPAATESVINEENAERVKASVIFEMANSPVTLAASTYLEEKGKVIVPDVLCNAGGVCVSYFEWLQDRKFEPMSHKQVNHELRRKMHYACKKVMDLHIDLGVSMRTAAYVLALKRIGEAVACLGTRDFFKS